METSGERRCDTVEAMKPRFPAMPTSDEGH